MLKKLDWYTIKTYFGPFIFIFSVLFFIFMVQFAWQEMEKFAGKGLDMVTIFELLFYLGLSVVQLVMPLTILLAAIMTFGGFGERYELAAMKSTGISLGRIMLPLFIMVSLLSVGLYYFSDYVVPKSQQKARNMLINIARTKPAVNFEPGVFVMGIPGFSMKVGDKSGDDGQFVEDVFIHKDVNAFENQQTIVASRGIFEPAEDQRFLRLSLFEGYFYEDEIHNKSREVLKRQPFRQIKFDTMVQYIDVSALVEKAIEDEKVTDHYKFMNSKDLVNRIDTLKMNDSITYVKMFDERYQTLLPRYYMLDSVSQHQTEAIPLPNLEEVKEEDRISIYKSAIAEVERDKTFYNATKSEISGRNKNKARHVLVLVRNYSNALMCIAFFLIGAPLGAIIRKGGVGMPVVVAIIIFILFYLVYMYTENLAKNGELDPYWASWSPVIVFFPMGLYFTYKAMTDSDIFDIESYIKPFRKLFAIFGTKKKEHARYQ
ncbi:LptF/LptG family permease [Weeksellaceae bacterium KMM 9713]|uniref:LptF/LptG family permease n=1 Tax=Profundicola chukchiensis TaxID=2961959 RepID=A0A9X4MYE5_9FLAO|nr:LptF/LptG family permease [Profundicola chukchiensis]MDG4945850.1 LptF/LptG family permease [Profundicola chukchiensis]